MRASTSSASSRPRTARSKNGAGHRRDPLSLRARGGGARHRAGERADRRQGHLHGRPRLGPHRRRVHQVHARPGRVHGRVAEPAGVGGRVAHPVPRERRRQPRPHGFQHAAPGGAAAAHRRAAGRHRHGAGRGARLRRHRARPARRRGRERRRDPYRRQGRQADATTAATPASTSTT